MNHLKPYSYVLLRAYPDAFTGERLNVGLVFYSPHQNYLVARMSGSIKRVTHAFPGVNGHGLKRVLSWIESSINRQAKSLKKQSRHLFQDNPESAESFATAHFQVDDSALQWSSQMVGLTDNPEAEASRLFDRLVSRYERATERSTRSDSDVWAHYLKAFENVGISDVLEEHTVGSAIEPYRFEHAIKNGIWHCLEPMSFDLIRPESIKTKARDKYAEMAFLRPQESQELKVYFLIGEPESEDGRRATETALKILSQSPIQSAIVPEREALNLAQTIASQLH